MKIQRIESVGIKRVVEIQVSQGTYISSTGVINHNCKVCRALYLHSDEITPKVYKLSEVAAQPIDTKGGKKQIPSIAPTHPNCRCLTSHLLPGWGFKDGKLHYFGEGYDEWEEQRKRE